MSEETPRILALDVGDRRIGVAVSDPLGNFAVGLETLHRSEKKDVLDDIAALVVQYDIRRFVLGLPVHLKGHEGTTAEKVRAFAAELEARFHLPVAFMDERLTSVLAQKTLRAQGIQGSKNKGLIDQASAVRILQDYLDSQAR